MRKSTLYIGATTIGCAVLFSLLAVWPLMNTNQRQRAWSARRGLAADLALTDLALFTESRYTRHPSQADLHAAFQDHPASFEHFPSGSMVLPPRVHGENSR